MADEAKAVERRQEPDPANGEYVTRLVCPSCQETFEPGDEGGPVYECSRCGASQVDENRCETDNIFMAKIAPESCPSCEAAFEDGTDIEEREVFMGADGSEYDSEAEYVAYHSPEAVAEREATEKREKVREAEQRAHREWKRLQEEQARAFAWERLEPLLTVQALKDDIAAFKTFLGGGGLIVMVKPEDLIEQLTGEVALSYDTITASGDFNHDAYEAREQWLKVRWWEVLRRMGEVDPDFVVAHRFDYNCSAFGVPVLQLMTTLTAVLTKRES